MSLWATSDNKLGDLLACLATVKALGGGSLFFHQDLPNTHSFLLYQPYINDMYHFQNDLVCYSKTEPNWGDWQEVRNLDKWYTKAVGRGPISKWCADAFNVTLENDAWLEAPNNRVASVVFNRSARYHNSDGMWRNAMLLYKDKIFVGTVQEHIDFEKSFGNIKYYPTTTLLDLAAVINGADLFLGNQSAAFWTAAGLGVPLVLEVNPLQPNCCLKRANILFCRDEFGNLIEWSDGKTGWPTLTN